jgi:5-methyltetrahydrofolate--homocysteine methyltransferase
MVTDSDPGEEAMDESIRIIQESIIEGRHKEIEAQVRAILKTGISPETLIQEGFIAAMDVVGQKFGDCEIFVPEMMVSALTMKLGLAIVKPLLTGQAGAPRGTIVMGTVKGDLHDIGKNIVITMLEGAGFQVIDLGVDTDVEKIVAKVTEIRPQVLGLSSLLTTSMSEMKRVIEELAARGLRDRIKVMVGGAPLDAAFAEKIGADGYGKDATQAIALARSFIGS